MLKKRLLVFVHICFLLSYGSIRADESIPLPALVGDDVVDNCIMPVLDTQGIAWYNSGHYITYLMMNDDHQIYFRTYLFDRITKSGSYKLASNVDNSITIDANNVLLDMNGYTLNGDLVVNSNLSNITIENGNVKNGTDGIRVNAGCRAITLNEITVENCVRGITFDRVTHSIIRDCDMVTNTTGLELNGSHNIVIENCTAQANVQAGFSLLSTTSVVIEDCKAIATGEGNNHAFGDASNVFGFVSHNGYGNIFERCIANATHATTTTSSESIVAGFGLKDNESCSKIIGCESSNNSSASSGLTIPYGIWLQNRFDGVVTITATNQVNTDDSAVAQWSPDGAYLAVAQNTAGIPVRVVLYQFDRTSSQLIAVHTVTPDNNNGSNDTIRVVQWSPNGQFVLAGGATFSGTFGNSLFLYRFDQSNETLVSVLEMNPNGDDAADIVQAISWSPDNKYVAVSTTTDLPQYFTVFVFRFDQVAQTLTRVLAFNPDGLDSSLNFPFEVSWSPDGNYLGVGGTFFNINETLFIYKFNKTTETISVVDAISPSGGGFNDTVQSIAWAPNGHFMAIGGSFLGPISNDDLILYRFDRVTEKLIRVYSINPGGGGSGDQINTLSWTSDSGYLAAGGVANLEDAYIFKFNRFTETLAQIAAINPGNGSLAEISSVAWTAHGENIVISGRAANPNNNIFMYQGLQFPRNNIITNNILYGDSGSNSPGGVGISGSSFGNLIIGNVAYANPINPAIVPSNYIFVTNVFNPLFNDAPTALQNIQLSSKIPIPSVYDIPAGLNRLELLAESLVDNLL